MQVRAKKWSKTQPYNKKIQRKSIRTKNKYKSRDNNDLRVNQTKLQLKGKIRKKGPRINKTSKITKKENYS